MYVISFLQSDRLMGGLYCCPISAAHGQKYAAKISWTAFHMQPEKVLHRLLKRIETNVKCAIYTAY